MDFSQIMEVIKTFLNAIVSLFKTLGLDKLFKKEEETTATAADETTTG